MSARYHLAVLGSPVAHSLSPVMHEAGLEALGLEGSYVAIDVDAAGMRMQADRIHRGDLTGANITMPHKQLAAALSEVRTALADRAGAVNTWYLDDGRLVGETTDVHGVRSVFARSGLPTDHVLILGTGGASAAALVACDGLRVALSGRTLERTERLIERTGVEAEIVPWGTVVSDATIVNATPLGMHGEELPDGILDGAAALFDMTYGSAPSPSLRRAQRRRLPIADGIDLLAAQAEESFRIWTGLSPPDGLFERVARNASRTKSVPPILEESE